jgi:hypothetical protein
MTRSHWIRTGAAGAGAALLAGVLAFGYTASDRRGPTRRTVPEGTVLVVRLAERLSSHESQPGETFRAEVTQDVAVRGTTVIPAGSTVVGSVTEAHRAEKIGGRARLTVDFHALELAGSEVVPISARLSQAGRSEVAKDAAIIGGSTLGGAILGEAIDEGEGTVIGAVVGGLGGALAAKRTGGKPLVVPAGTRLSLELEHPVTVVLTNEPGSGHGTRGLR